MLITKYRRANKILKIGGQTNEQTNERTNEQTNKRTNEQTNERTNGPRLSIILVNNKLILSKTSRK